MFGLGSLGATAFRTMLSSPSPQLATVAGEHFAARRACDKNYWKLLAHGCIFARYNAGGKVWRDLIIRP